MTMETIARPCWICGDPADSGEHLFKARDLKRLFDRDGYAFNDLPFHFRDDGHRRIPGPKSQDMKYPALICRRCNNERTSDFDRAYDQFSDALVARQPDHDIREMDMEEIFGPTYSDGIERLHRYYAKSLGCRLLASDTVLPTGFPNPVTGENMHLLQITLCRAEPFRSLKNYRSDLMQRYLGKGEVLVNYSRSHFEATGEREVMDAIWWENLGHFQVNYWFNLQPNPAFGTVLDGHCPIYPIHHVDLDLKGIKEAMFGWLSRDVG